MSHLVVCLRWRSRTVRAGQRRRQSSNSLGGSSTSPPLEADRASSSDLPNPAQPSIRPPAELANSEAPPEPGASEFPAVLSGLLGRGYVLGARVVAWHARAFALEFPPEALDDALRLILESPLEHFGIGIAEGELAIHVEAGDRVALGTGAALDQATLLAWIAEPGDVLLEPTLSAVLEDRVLTRGTRWGTCGKQRVRGLRLDLRHPWRVVEAFPPIASPPLLGVSVLDIQPESGSLTLVRAARGTGGSRLLDELARIGGMHSLQISSFPRGEPLGGLRAAFQRAGSAGVAAHETLESGQQSSLESLLAGEGLDPEASADLLEAWLLRDPAGWLLIDDLDELDRDTLEAVGAALSRRRIRGVARVGEDGSAPPLVTIAPASAEIRLGALDEGRSELFVRACSSGQMPVAAVRRWARRGGGIPLALVESLCWGMESGELIFAEDQLQARKRVGGRGGVQSARFWMKKRLALLDPSERGLLDAIFVLGGAAELLDLSRFLEETGNSLVPELQLSSLIARGWLRREKEWVYLSNSTLADLIQELFAQARRISSLEAAAAALRQSSRPLGVAQAAVLALRAGNRPLALDLARQASAVARAAGLEETAQALQEFAHSGDGQQLVKRGLWVGATEPFQLPPVQELPESQATALSEPLIASHATPAEEARPSESALEMPPPEHLAKRASVWAAFLSGEEGVALGLLRSAKERVQGNGSSDRCRAALAYGVGLARVGRTHEALLEALDGLARARECSDSRGERACSLFIAQLTEQAGYEALGEAWRRVAE